MSDTSTRVGFGIVTALPIEYAAMSRLLDRQERIGLPHDPSHYVIGQLPSIREGQPHLVALTMLSRDGTRTAAAACAYLLAGFPMIRAIVMVGIAGGVPVADDPRRHVRLGDIVVATEIIDYGHVRAVGGAQEIRARIDGPSVDLVIADRVLQAGEVAGHRPWEEWLQSDPALPPHVFARPGPETDILFTADRVVAHPDDSRHGRRPGLPRIHRGIVASGDQLVRDEAIRDQLAARHDVCAIEMEGVGIAAGTTLRRVPWFMVRGIADYCNNTKNDLWHPHASLAAAAYVRALLGHCKPLNDFGRWTTGATKTQPDDRAHADRSPSVFEGVPTRNPHFTGREWLLGDLRDRLVSAERIALLPQALHGIGGVGKTQLAVEYCHRFANDYDLVLWIPAEQPAIVRTTLAQLAEQLRLPRFEDQSQAVAAVLRTLRRGEVYGRWLLVFDNADRPEDVEALMPDLHGPGHILITSRNQRWSDNAQILEVDVFARLESIDLLQRRRPGIATRDADRLADKLGDLPLALDQAAAWQAETGMPVAEYLELIDERMEQLLDVAALGSYPKSVAATWRIAFERLQEEAPASLQLLELCAFFGAEPIANELIPMGRSAPSLPVELRMTFADGIALGRAMRQLGRYALAKVDHSTNSLQVHRLVQAVLRESVDPRQAVAYRRGVQEMLAAYNPGDPDNQETWSRHARISPHIMASRAVEGSIHDIRRLILDHVRYLQRRGSLKDSAELGGLAYHRWRTDSRLGPDHEDTLICGRLLAISLRGLGSTEQAREMNEDTLARQQRVFGEDHEHSLLTANSLGADLRLAGELTAARDLGERTYNAELRVFGEDDIRTLHAANNRATDLNLAGRFREATELNERTLASFRRVYGETDPFTLSSYASLGCDYLEGGRYAEAKTALRHAIDGYERIFGPEHPHLLAAYRCLGVLLRRIGDLKGSYVCAETNVRRSHERLGPGHEQTLGATMSLCNTMRLLGRTREAADRARELLDRYREMLGHTNPLTLACAANLAIALRQTGQLREARRLDELAVAAFADRLGEKHPSTLLASNNLAHDLHLAGEHAAALDLSAVTLERTRAVRGPDDPYTLASAANHAIDLHAAGRHDAARALETPTLQRLRELVGDGHPHALAARARARIDIEIDPLPY